MGGGAARRRADAGELLPEPALAPTESIGSGTAPPPASRATMFAGDGWLGDE